MAIPSLLPFGRDIWVLVVIILLAFTLRVYGLGRAPLWFDEVLSGTIAQKGWAGIVAHTSVTPFEHPPLYYLALHIWTRLTGSGEFSLRFFSLLWGVLLIPLLYRFITPWAGRRLALLTALLMAISATHIDHSQNVRMYTLILFLGVLSLYFFFRGLVSRRRLWWAGYLLVTGAGIAIHYYFSLLLLVPLTFLLVRGAQYRRTLILFAALLLGAGLPVAVWLWLSPGPHQAMLQILHGEGAGGSSLILRISHTFGGLLLEESAPGPLLLGMLALLGVVRWPRLPARQTHPLSAFGSRQFLLIWLVVPWLVALVIPYWLQGRHLAYLWPALFALVAAGLLTLRAKSPWLFLLGLLLIGLTSAYDLYLQNQIRLNRPEYDRIIAYIEDQALPDDLVIMNQPAMWPFWEYYSRRDLQVAYVPANPAEASQEKVAQQLEELIEGHSRLWLGPVSAWTADPDSLVERWLVSHTLQAEKAWFSESGSAALYFAPVEEMVQVGTGRLVWGGCILLQNVQAGHLQVRPGDAVRLRFNWSAGFDLDRRYIIELTLVDSEGRVWSERRSEPCADWCPTDTWRMGRHQQDQHALLVPPGTPPGTYRVQMSWVPLGEESKVPVEADGEQGEQATVAEVKVLPALVGQAPVGLPNPLRATFGGEITLSGYELAPTEAHPGDVLHLKTGWRVEKRPTADYTLRLELVDRRQRPMAGWEFTPSASFYPTSMWKQGQYLAGQQELLLPHTLTPGLYGLRLAMIGPDGERLALSGEHSRPALAGLFTRQEQLAGESFILSEVRLVDRPRQFKRRPMQHSLSATVGQQAHLIGYDLDTSQAQPGGRVLLTLYWQADGPMVQPFKVFTHLVDSEDTILAQHDAMPGGGCCPANTWAKGEIIVDEHPIALKTDLPPGSYQLVVGLYDEKADVRLPAYAADGQPFVQDRIPIATVVVEPAGVAGQVPSAPPTPKFEWEHKIFLPCIGKGE